MTLVIYCNFFSRIDLYILKLVMILLVFDHLRVAIKSIMISNEKYINSIP